LKKDTLALCHGIGVLAPGVPMGHAKHNETNATGFVRNFGGTARRDLHGVEMPAVAQAVDAGCQHLVDLQKDQRLLDLPGPISREPIEAGRHRIPIAAQIATHEPGDFGEAAEGIAEDDRTFTGLNDAQFDLSIIEAPIVLPMGRRGAVDVVPCRQRIARLSPSWNASSACVTGATLHVNGGMDMVIDGHTENPGPKVQWWCLFRSARLRRRPKPVRRP
jgi:hypothetical protein